MGAWRSAAIIGAFLAGGLVAAGLLADRLNPLPLDRASAMSVRVEAADGTTLRAFLAPDGRWRFKAAPADVNPLYLKLLIAYEDQRFADHPGVDPFAALRAAWQLAREARIVSGASTLTMQVARLLEPGPRTFATKLRQAARAVQLEGHLTKDEILGLYLTLAPFGGNIEGVEAAAWAWLGKSARHLTLGEAALLVALPQAPERRRPDRHPEAARAARDRVLDRLAERGAITPAAAAEAQGEPAPTARRAFPLVAPQLAERLKRDAPGTAVIPTTLDAPIQAAMEALARRTAEAAGDDANIAIIAIETATRRVIASVGASDFLSRGGKLDLTHRSRSPGSALKPFIYALAFEDLAIHPATEIDDVPMRFGSYAPQNFDRGFQGTVPVRFALQASLNVPAVALLDRIGPVRLWATLRNGGARLTFPRGASAPTLPIALGGVGITLADLAMLYAALADGGAAVPLVYRRDAPAAPVPVRLFGAAAAWQVRDILRGAPLPDGFARGIGIERARTIGFKTGTSYGYRDAWSIGFSGRYVVGVWTGRTDGSPRPGRYGRLDAAPVMFQAFDLLPAEPPLHDPAPEGITAATTSADLPAAMRRFVPQREAAQMQRREAPPPSVRFPPDGATVPLAAEGEDSEVPLRADGGAGSLTWVVNGEILPAVPAGTTQFFEPDGEGFATIAVIDSLGRSAQARVRFVRP